MQAALAAARRGPDRTVIALIRNRVGARLRQDYLDAEMTDSEATRMLSPDRIRDLTIAADDYDVVRRAIAHIRGNWREQPDIDTIAEAAKVTPTELHHLFRRWAGLTPKEFLPR